MSYEYTVAVCNYNMVRTVKQSVQSILNHTTDDFEILVVDGGSTDGSLRVLRTLAADCERLRILNTDDHNSEGLGTDRNVAVKEAKGNHVLTQLDADDRYYQGILDFITVYEQLRSQLDFPLYLKGDNINVGEREFLLDFGPYRSGLTRGEDRDLWRRLFSADTIIWLKHGAISRPIGYEPGNLKQLLQEYEGRVSDFRSGITLLSFLTWAHQNMSTFGFGLHSVLGSIAYIQARKKGIYGLPDEYTRMGRLEDAIADQSGTLPEIASRYNVRIEKEKFSDIGLRIFYGEV